MKVFEPDTAPKKFRGQKHAKFVPISVDFKVWRRISPEQNEDIQNRWVIRSTAISPALGETSPVKFGNLGDLDVRLYPPKAHFSENHISVPRGGAPPNFYTR